MRYPKNMSDTITLYTAQDSEPRQRTVIHGCCYARQSQKAKIGDVQIATSTDLVQIRAQADRQWSVDTDSIIVLGECPFEMSENPGVPNSKTRVQFLRDYRFSGIFVVDSFEDNSKPGLPMPHYVCRGERQ